jgi:hypothetical protein
VWGTDDVYFDVKWARWLADTIPGTRRVVEIDGARLFLPDERWSQLNEELRAHWQAAAHDGQDRRDGGGERIASRTRDGGVAHPHVSRVAPP